MNVSDRINKTLQGVKPSGIRRFFDIAAEMEDVISLGVGEPDFVTPWKMREAAIWSLEKGETHYTSNSGLLELRKSISAYMQTRFNLQYQPIGEICITVGASEGIDLALRTLLEQGEEVLVPDPSYVSYSSCVQMAGGVPVSLPTFAEEDFRITPEVLRAHITPKTKVLILPYPNNPSGGIMTRSDLEGIARVLADTEIMVISDEVYAELTYSSERHVSLAELPRMWERTVVLSGFSKAFAMTGWRVGYACGHSSIIAAMTKIHQFTMLCAPIMGQIAAMEGLRSEMDNGFPEVRQMVRSYNRRRRIMVQALREMGLDCFEPQGAFYAFPSIRSTGMASDEFAERLLAEERVVVVPGNAFGVSGEGHVRCCYAASVENIRMAMERMACFVAKHT